jgi:hypothetical protein
MQSALYWVDIPLVLAQSFSNVITLAEVNKQMTDVHPCVTCLCFHTCCVILPSIMCTLSWDAVVNALFWMGS